MKKSLVLILLVTDFINLKMNTRLYSRAVIKISKRQYIHTCKSSELKYIIHSDTGELSMHLEGVISVCI